MESPTTLIFDSPKILKSTLRDDDDREVKYITTTVQQGRSNRHTTSLEGAPGTPNAVIDWKKKTFEISGSKRNMADLRSRRARFSSSRYWSWFDCEEYKVKYEAEMENTWTVFSYSGTVLATFTSQVQRIFKDNAQPVLRISESIQDEVERRFIILVLLYSETKRLESLKERPLSVVGDFLINMS
ncbi:hypothetical protein B0H13DRAFT_2016278 [Mycena leptocephala]|nr:hypothetical protein B0H13DRAFT_2016278 [Mycena leptocephala]